MSNRAKPTTSGSNNLPAAKSVGIWIRVSHEDQVKGESPEHHERRALMYAEAKGWQVREVYRLDAVSGKSVMSLPEAQAMLADVRSGRITGLIFSKLARLARNTRELLEFADIFREHGADLISLHESIDTTTPAGRLQLHILAALAEFERARIAERVKAGLALARARGQRLGRPRLSPLPETLPDGLSVREAGALWGVSKSTAARWLATGRMPMGQTLSAEPAVSPCVYATDETRSLAGTIG